MPDASGSAQNEATQARALRNEPSNPEMRPNYMQLADADVPDLMSAVVNRFREHKIDERAALIIAAEMLRVLWDNQPTLPVDTLQRLLADRSKHHD